VAAAAPTLGQALLDLAADNRYADVRLDDVGGPVVGFTEAWDGLLVDELRREAGRIGTSELRVSASLVQFGVAEKLLAVRLGLWARHDLVLDADAIGICIGTPRWRFGLRRSADDPTLVSAPDPALDDDTVADTIAASVLTDLEVLHQAIRRHCRIADGVLWGNVAVGVVCQAARHHRHDPARAGRRMVHLRNRLLSQPPLRGRVSGVDLDDGDPAYRRTTCCLYYRSAAAETCNDCAITGSVVARTCAGRAP
jgi:hypothetical protein